MCMIKGKSKYNGQFKIGDKFGKWMIVDENPVFNSWTTTKEYVILVECECGTKKHVSCRNLKNGISWGCDCVRRNENSFHWKGFGEIPKTYLSQIKESAIKRDIEISITDEYIWNLFLKQNRKCALSGLEIEFGSYRRNSTTSSLDRIDSTMGYVEGNVQWVHKDINLMKNILNVEKFKKLCKMVTDYGN